MKIEFKGFRDWKRDGKRYWKNLKDGKPLINNRDVFSFVKIVFNSCLPLIAGYLIAIHSKWWILIAIPSLLFDVEIKEVKPHTTKRTGEGK